jgi:hypothetical protein
VISATLFSFEKYADDKAKQAPAAAQRDRSVKP